MARVMRITATVELPPDPFDEAKALCALEEVVTAFRSGIAAQNGTATCDLIAPRQPRNGNGH